MGINSLSSQGVSKLAASSLGIASVTLVMSKSAKDLKPEQFLPGGNSYPQEPAKKSTLTQRIGQKYGREDYGEDEFEGREIRQIWTDEVTKDYVPEPQEWANTLNEFNKNNESKLKEVKANVSNHPGYQLMEDHLKVEDWEMEP